jgi:hypothetical protein
MSERLQPRISLNALTEYLKANATRRRRIIEEQKRPNDFQVIYYQPAQDAIVEFLVSSASDESILEQAMDRLDSLDPKNDYQERRWPNNVEAIQSFLNFYEDIDFESLNAVAGPSDQPRLTFSNISLSIRPDILLSGNLTRYGDVIGAVKLYFTKDEELFLTSQSGQCSTSLLYQFLSEYHPQRRPLPRLCFTIDVFGQTVHTAPRSYRRLLNEVSEACEEIAVRWPQV